MTRAFASSRLNSVHKLQQSKLAPDQGKIVIASSPIAVSATIEGISWEDGDPNQKEVSVVTEMRCTWRLIIHILIDC